MLQMVQIQIVLEMLEWSVRVAQAVQPTVPSYNEIAHKKRASTLNCDRIR